jgi:hypothetical protein
MLNLILTMTLVALPEAKDDAGLTAAVKKAAEMSSYSFTLTTDSGKGAGGVVEGKYQKGQPAWLKADKVPFFRKGEALVYQQGGQWKRSKTGIQSDPLLILGAVAKVRPAKLPHEELAGFAKNFKKVERSAKKDFTLYEGTLTDDAVKRLVKSEFKSVAQGGTARLWVNNKGLIVRYEITIQVKGRLGNAEVNGSTTRNVELSEIGSTKVEVPKEVGKLLP